MRSICVFCGSSAGSDPSYAQVARDFGALLAEHDLTLVFGGGRVGLMGAVADSALAAGGRVIGVMPQFLLDREVGHDGLTQLHVVETMAQRKAVMGELSDAFVSLPGGIGTLDELFEAWSWTQLGLERKPSGILNHDGFYDSLLTFLDHATATGFIRPRFRDILIAASDPTTLLQRLDQASQPEDPLRSIS